MSTPLWPKTARNSSARAIFKANRNEFFACITTVAKIFYNFTRKNEKKLNFLKKFIKTPLTNLKFVVKYMCRQESFIIESKFVGILRRPCALCSFSGIIYEKRRLRKNVQPSLFSFAYGSLRKLVLFGITSAASTTFAATASNFYAV